VLKLLLEEETRTRPGIPDALDQAIAELASFPR
jgi:hypothetical protein